MSSQHALSKIRDLVRAAAWNKKITKETVLRIDHETEWGLCELAASEVGDMAGRILVHGARGVFDSIYGIPVEWNAEKLELYHGPRPVDGN